MLDDFIEPDSTTERELQIIRTIVEQMGKQQALSGFGQAVELDLVRTFIKHRLQQRYSGSGFISGGVTFCAMLPMRSIPFKIVCLMGMNSDSFPRDVYTPDFDLIRRFPRSGDRQRRNDDRYLFLEALLSARQILYISYVGQSTADNTRMPPSVLVSELIETVSRNYGVEADSMLIRHPLQAFSTKYFNSVRDRLFSYSEENYDAVAQTFDKTGTTAFFDKPLTEADDSYRILDVPRLQQFFVNPTRFLLQNRLDLYLRKTQPVLADIENFSLGALDRYDIQRDILTQKNTLPPFETFIARQKAKGSVPPGAVGQVALSGLYDDSLKIIAKYRRMVSDSRARLLDVDIRIGDFRITGSITDIFPVGLVRMHPGKKRCRHILAGWISHLVFCTAGKSEKDLGTLMLFDDGDLKFEAVEEPSNILESLLTLYWEGLHRPLHLFPESSMIFSQQVMLKGRTEKQALHKARQKWLGSEFSRGEINDVYFKQCFEKTDPLDDRFRHVALQIYQPLFEHMVEEG